MTDEPTLYEILGLQKDATPDEVRLAYRAASKTAHPDAGGSPGLFLMVLHAFETLSDPHQRELYDSGVEVMNTKQQEIDDLKEKLRSQHTKAAQPPAPPGGDLPQEPPALQLGSPKTKERPSTRRKVRAHWDHWLAHCLGIAAGPVAWAATGSLLPESWDTSGKVSPALSTFLRFLFPKEFSPAIAACLCLALYALAYTRNVPRHIRVFAPIARWSLLGVWLSLAGLFFTLSSTRAYVLCGSCVLVMTAYGFVWRRYVRHQDAGLKL